jgi:hypothetical protein
MKCIAIKTAIIRGEYFGNLKINENEIYEYYISNDYKFRVNEDIVFCNQEIIDKKFLYENKIYISKEDLIFGGEGDPEDLKIPKNTKFILEEIINIYIINSKEIQENIFFEYFKPLHILREEKINSILED